jgi:two-component system sensor histidine kinase KdpD
LPQVVRILVTHVEQIMGGQAAVLVDNGRKLELSHASDGFPLDEDEYAVASWAFTHRQAAGRGTDTLAGADGFYLPLRAARDVVGVLGIVAASAATTDGPLHAEQRRLLESLASQAAVAIERSLLAEKAQEAQLLRETEKLQAALLNSISHDLRTPLAAITGALSSLHDDSAILNGQARQELLSNAYEEAERLNNLVANLLDMSRLEAGALRIRTTDVDIEDLLGVALSNLARRLHDRQVVMETTDDLPLVAGDFVLLVRVLVNLLDNADKYAPPGSAITLRSFVRGSELLVQVLDQGPGVPEGEREHIFDKFYRAETGAPEAGQRPSPPDRSGTGLGLSISKGIVEAHRGRIWVENRPGGGAIFTVALPLASQVETALRR